jgi:hypothetical protein
MSERQLALALLQSGRPVTLHDLTRWRRADLLPPFASYGTGAGRTYYWLESDIQAQAQAVYDALVRHSRIDNALISVWLAGFSVPLARLRRALLGRGRTARSSVATMPAGRTVPPVAAGGDLLAHAFGALAALTAPQNDCRKLASEILKRPKGLQSRQDLRSHLTGIALVYGPLLEKTGLLRASKDEELLLSRRYFLALMEGANQSRDEETCERLFLFFLGLVHSGQQEFLQAVDSLPGTQAGTQAGSISSRNGAGLQVAS